MSRSTDDRPLRRMHLPGEPGYERLRLSSARSADWNRRIVGRYPAAVVEAADEADVVAAVRLARERGWTVKARSGGHSWTDSSVRDGALLIDLSAMTETHVDARTRTAVVGPGVKGQELDRVLEPLGLYFPTGGCLDVGLGGFLLQGGFGFNRQVLGPACASVRAIDVVTAAGEVVHAEGTENADLFWAARGAGAGYFGIVTRFYLDLHPLPAVSLSSGYFFSLDAAGEVLDWLMDEHDRGAVPPELMLGVTVCPALGDGTGGAEGSAVLLRGSTSADSEAAAREVLALLDDAPLSLGAAHRQPAEPVVVSDRRGFASALYPDGWTYVADNMWTDATRGELAPLVTACLVDLPTARSHVSLEAYHPHDLPDMAFSVEGRYYVALYGVAGDDDAAPEEELVAWTTRHLQRMDHLSEGIQLADENLIARPALGLRPDHAARLEALRQEHDPGGLFESYLVGDEVEESR